jgi:DNA-binding IclR family transcriptional regulator
VSETQLNLARIYRSMGLKPEEIAQKLDLTPSETTRLLLAATSGPRR